jgi:hypothetical protein
MSDAQDPVFIITKMGNKIRNSQTDDTSPFLASQHRRRPSRQAVNIRGFIGCSSMATTACNHSLLISPAELGHHQAPYRGDISFHRADRSHLKKVGCQVHNWRTWTRRTSGCSQVARTDMVGVSQMMSLPSTPAVAHSGSTRAIPAASTESECPEEVQAP